MEARRNAIGETMATILEITDDGRVCLGSQGNLFEIRRVDVKYDDPQVGDEVDVYQSSDRTVVTKAKEPEEPKQQPEPVARSESGGVSVVVQNGPVQAPPPVKEEVFIDGKKLVNKTTYCLLAFFLGAIGIHKFYAGKTGMGILYLLFCWTFVPAVVAFIEFIIGLSKQPDAYGRIAV